MKKRTWKIIITAFLAVIVIVLLLLPGIARKMLVKNGKEWVGRQISIDDLGFNYFTGTLSITGFKMYESNQSDVFISFDTLLIDAEPHRLFVNEFVFNMVYLHGLDTKIIYKDSTFNFEDLIAFYLTPGDTSSSENEEPYHYKISNIEISDAELEFDNRRINNISKIRDLSFLIPFIGWNQEDASEAGLRFAFKNEGYFESLLHLDQHTGEYDADITIHRLYLNDFNKYVQQYAQIDTVQGILNTHISITGNINQPENSILSSRTEILNFEMTDKNNKKFLGAERIYTAIERANYVSQNYIVDTLALTTPYVFFELRDSSNNLFEIFDVGENKSSVPNVGKIETTALDTASTLYYALNNLIIDDGIIDYSDNITGQPFDYHLSEIEVDADSIKSTSKWVEINADMLLNNRGTLKADLGVNPANIFDIDLDFTIEKFQLADINIYSNFYIGHTILEGDMFYTSDTKIRDGQIESENKLLVKNAKLNSNKKGLYKLPLKFALFLLKDKNGDVNLDVPVRGDLKDPEINVGKMVWHTFKNLIFKAAAAPGKLLAGVVNGDPKDMENIGFGYLDTALTEHQVKQLDMLIELEQKKPELETNLIYYNDIELQKQAIAASEAGKLYYKKTKKDYLKNDAGFKAFLKKKTGVDSLDYNLACLTLSTPELVDSLSILYTESRFSNINRVLQSNNDSTLIKVENGEVNAPENTGSSPIFKIVFSMKDDEAEN